MSRLGLSKCLFLPISSWRYWPFLSPGESWDPQTCRTRGSSATSSGPTRTRTRWAGERTTGGSASPSGRRWWPSFYTNTTSIWYAELTRSVSRNRGLVRFNSIYCCRWWRTDTSSSLRGSWSLSSLLLTTAGSLIMQVRDSDRGSVTLYVMIFLSGAMMSVDETLMCSFQILKPADKKKFPYGGLNAGRPVTPPRGATVQKAKGKKWMERNDNSDAEILSVT